jgi:predicted DNA-binding protein
MEYSKKTTILFSPELHERLVQLARQKGVSLGYLVRSACETQYGLVAVEDRLEAVRELSRLSLPVADTRTMKEQSVPDVSDLLP